MPTVLNVKVGSKITFRDATTGAELDGEVVELPKILRVKTVDGAVQDIRAEQVLAEEAKPSGGKFSNRFAR